jgi:hypothetical protein
MADEQVATETHRSAAERHKIVSKKTASQKFLLNFNWPDPRRAARASHQS